MSVAEELQRRTNRVTSASGGKTKLSALNCIAPFSAFTTSPSLRRALLASCSHIYLWFSPDLCKKALFGTL